MIYKLAPTYISLFPTPTWLNFLADPPGPSSFTVAPLKFLKRLARKQPSASSSRKGAVKRLGRQRVFCWKERGDSQTILAGSRRIMPGVSDRKSAVEEDVFPRPKASFSGHLPDLAPLPLSARAATRTRERGGPASGG